MVLPTQKYIVLDIEGTICSISFVRDILFPYFLDSVPSSLKDYFSDSQSSEELKPYIDSFPEDVRSDYDKLLDYIKDLTLADIKDSALKSLQGYVWKDGYSSGKVKAPLYDDAYSAFEKWNSSPDGLYNIYIYSSGSVNAQILLFSHTERGDLTKYIKGYFDTVNIGPKTEVSSYEKIVEKVSPENNSQEVLFLSDNIKEIAAAKQAGLEAYVVERPGNVPLTEDDRSQNKVISDLKSLI
ncbi:HAD-like domain-containing protein [Dipodascopsis uninucleata]